MAVRIKLREIAQSRHIGQSKLSRKADVDLRMIQRFYHDPTTNTTITTLEKLCRALNCTPNDLLDFDPPLTPFS